MAAVLPPSFAWSPAFTPLAELTAQLTRWCAQNSGSTHLAGLELMAQMLAEDFSQLPDTTVNLLPGGGYTDLDGQSCATGPAVQVLCRSEAPRRVILGGHHDTVFPVDHLFQTPTLRPDGTLHAPGAMDMKGGLLVMLEALRLFAQSPHADDLGWEVLIPADEEIGTPGSRAYWDAAAERAHLGMIFEAAMVDGGCVRARYGSATYRAQVLGQAAHAGRHFEDGRNAIVAASHLAIALHELNQRLPSGANLNVGRIVGGGPLNVVPDETCVYLNVRMARGVDVPVVEALLAEARARLAAHDGIRLEWTGEVSRLPRENTPELTAAIEALQATAAQLGWTLPTGDTAGGSDGNLLQAAGVTTLDGLGVRGEGLHSDAEYAVMESIPERAALSAAFLHRCARGDFDGTLFPV